jgi:PAS domain S-box-containing protein
MPIQTAITRESLVADMRRAYMLGASGLLFIALTVLCVGWLDRALMGSIFSSREVTKLARQARLLTLDRETAVRGYLLNGDVRSRQPENAARVALPAHLDSLVALTSASASRRDRAEAIRQAVARWERGYVNPALGGTAAGRDSALQELAGKELFNSVRGAFASFISAEERLYGQRVAFEQFVVRFSTVIILLEILFVILMMRRLSRRTIGQAQQVLEQQEQLEEQAAELEQQALELEEQAAQLEEQYEHTLTTTTALEESNDELKATVEQLETSRDETRRLSVERERAQSLLDFVLDSSPVGFGLFDRSLRFTIVNEAMAVINHLPARDLIGKSPRDLVSPELAEQAEVLLTGVMESGEPVLNVPLTGSIASQPGTERHWLVSYFPVHSGPEKETLGVGIMCSEVTDRKRLEEQLGESRKMEAVGRLAGGVAHDFNNLLTAIKSYSELLLSDMEESNPQRSDVSEINSAADRAAALTRQLLAFSRQQMLRPEVMDLNRVIAEMQGVLRPLAGRTIKLETRLSAIGHVSADPSQIERVILNLVMNARDAMPDGGSITIETANVELDEAYISEHRGSIAGPHVMLAVSDTGIGMTKEVRDRLFEPFFTTKPRGKGTGLGLATVHGIVNQSGGHVWAYSEPNKGSTFKVYLPVDEKAALPLEGVHARVPASRGATIMLVEDDDVVRNVAARVLKRAGFAVLEAANGVDALELYKVTDACADLIVTDVVMPEMNGPEMAEHILRMNPSAKILFMSGYTEDRVLRENLLAPGAAFLEKPFSPDALIRKTREILEGPETSGAAA